MLRLQELLVGGVEDYRAKADKADASEARLLLAMGANTPQSAAAAEWTPVRIAD